MSGGTTSHGGSNPSVTADGSTRIEPHQKGSLFGKSGITAPMNSLLGVFLSADDPINSVASEKLNFSDANSRNYSSLLPKLGQVFFIGNGRFDGDKFQLVIVPKGATRLYFAIHDSYEWNNNSGTLQGAILWRP